MYKNCSKVLFQSYPDTPDAEEKNTSRDKVILNTVPTY